MTAVTGFGLGSDQGQYPTFVTPSEPKPDLRFTALDGLSGLAVPFVLAFALRADLARLHAPTAVQYLADGGYVLVNLFFVMAGFMLCRPLSAILAGAGAGHLGKGLAWQIAPLHLIAWAITFGWLVTGTSPGTVWDWLSGVLLLNGVVGPERTGYPVSWSVSVALFCVILLVAAALGLARAGGTRRTGRSRTGRDSALTGSGRSVTVIALTAGLIGAALLLTGGSPLPEGSLLPAGFTTAGTLGLAAIGAALLGLGTGILTFRVLEGATGSLTVPRSGTVPAPRPAPGMGSLLALAALLFSVYRSDLAYEWDLLPSFPAAAALVYFLALPHESGQSPVNRVLESQLLQWLGSRALALYLLHGPVQLTVERICEVRGLDRGSTSVAYGVLGAVVLGSLVAADLGYRLLNRSPAAPAPVPVAAVSVYRQPHSRPERISQIDPRTIPSELRLLPLPRKHATSEPATKVSETPTDPTPAGPTGPTGPSSPASPAGPPARTPSETAAGGPSTQPINLPGGKPIRKSTAASMTRKPAESPAAKTAEPSVAKAVARPARKPVRRPATKSIKLPLDPTDSSPDALSPDQPLISSPTKPAGKLAARKPVAKVDQPIDLDRTPGPGSTDRVLDADATSLDADR